MSRVVDVAGQRFGKLRVLRRSERTISTGALWICQCDCGGTTTTTSLKLRSGHTSSCGCHKLSCIAGQNKTHGRSRLRDRTYRSWKQMRQRCLNPECDQWEWYGGRDIKICERWTSFEVFLTDMGERPQGMTLDRYPNNDGHYEPGNCRWATAKQQAETNRGIFKPKRAA